MSFQAESVFTPKNPDGQAERKLIVVSPGAHAPGRLAMPGGTIKRIVRDRGFGFIRDDGGQEWFFHRSAVDGSSFDDLTEGQRVKFDEEPSAKGPRAAKVRSEG
jgi:CspA family cold shock protein